MSNCFLENYFPLLLFFFEGKDLTGKGPVQLGSRTLRPVQIVLLSRVSVVFCQTNGKARSWMLVEAFGLVSILPPN